MNNLNQIEVEGIERQLATLIKKKHRLGDALVLAIDESVKIKYEDDIQACELRIEELKAQLSKIHNLHGSSGAQLLLQKIHDIDLEIDEMGEQDLVNVNREAERQRFYDQFEHLLQSNFQFYCISGCPTQMPHSFSEWAILEIAFEELEEELSAIWYRRRAESNRVQIFQLPVGRNLEKSKKDFKKFFAKEFKFKPHVTFDKYIETGLPALPYEYVAFVFDFDGTNWLPFHKAYLQWIIDTFQHPHENMPTFVFFFVLTRDSLHNKAEGEYSNDLMVKDLDDLAQSNAATAHISPLRPVPVMDLQRWFRQLGERNPSRIEEVIELMLKGLKPKDKQLFKEKKLLNMDDVERFQELIYEWYLAGE